MGVPNCRFSKLRSLFKDPQFIQRNNSRDTRHCKSTKPTHCRTMALIIQKISFIPFSRKNWIEWSKKSIIFFAWRLSYETYFQRKDYFSRPLWTGLTKPIQNKSVSFGAKIRNRPSSLNMKPSVRMLKD